MSDLFSLPDVSERTSTKHRVTALEPVADMLAADVGADIPYWQDYNSDRCYQAFCAAKKSGSATLRMKMSDGSVSYMHIRLDENGELPFIISKSAEFPT